MRALCAIYLACAVFGCGAGEDPGLVDASVPEGQLVLGSSDPSGSGFLPVEDGADVELVAGAQGGFHVWTTMQVTGAAGALYLEREARLVADDALILRAQRLYMEVPEAAMEDWWTQDAASPSFMCPSPIGLKVFDVEVKLTGRLVDDDGEVMAEDSVVVVPRCVDNDQQDFCREICSG